VEAGARSAGLAGFLVLLDFFALLNFSGSSIGPG
jgi:hypothetical protein